MDSFAAQRCQLKREPLLLVFWCVVLGIFVDRFCGDRILRFLPQQPVAAWWLLAALLALALWRYSLWPSVSRAALFLSIVGSGAAWHHCYWNYYPADTIFRFATAAGSPVCVRGVALTSPRNVDHDVEPLSLVINSCQSTFELRITHMRRGVDEWIPVSGQAVVRLRGHDITTGVGDSLQLWGTLSRPKPSMNPDSWSAMDHARSHRTLCRLAVQHPQCIHRTGTASSWDARWWVARVRTWARKVLLSEITAPSGAMAVAVLLGQRDFVADSTMDTFLVTGTIHLLAISGLHVGILAYALLSMLRAFRLPRRSSLWTVMLFCLFYAILTGGRAPVVRATVIVWVACSGLLFHRQAFSFNAMAAAGVIVLAFNPTQVFAAGAQLSFLAVACIAWIVPWIAEPTAGQLSRRIYKHHRSFARMILAHVLRKFLGVGVATIVIWIIALPLVMYYFHLASPVALLLNPFLWVPLSLALFAGFATLISAGISSLVPIPMDGMTDVAAWLCGACLDTLQNVVQFFEPMPGGYYWVVGPTLLALVTFYSALCVGLSWQPARRRWHRTLAICVALLLVTWSQSLETEHAETRLTFLSMGQGSCVVLETPNGETWLYDAGRLGSSRSAVNEIAQYLWKKRTRRITGVIVSHADIDHFNAVPGLTERFDVGCVFVSPDMIANGEPATRAMFAALDRAGVSVKAVQRGDSIRIADAIVADVLFPRPDLPQATADRSDNERSLVICIRSEGRRVLLPGDIEGSAMSELLAASRIDCDLALAPHHGSQNSMPADYVAWASPEYVVVAGGQRQVAARGAATYEQCGATVLNTNVDGAVIAIIDAGRLAVDSYLP